MKQKLEGKVIPPGHKVFSLDFVSLFTNIPWELVEKSIYEKWHTIRQHTEIPLTSFINGLKLLWNNCIFTYQGETCKQIFGTPMGSPVSPPIAELVLELVETEAFEELARRGINVDFWWRYVDDSLSSALEEKIATVVEVFNGIHPRIQVTIENEKLEVDSRGVVVRTLPILDMKAMVYQDGSIRTNW